MSESRLSGLHRAASGSPLAHALRVCDAARFAYVRALVRVIARDRVHALRVGRAALACASESLARAGAPPIAWTRIRPLVRLARRSYAYDAQPRGGWPTFEDACERAGVRPYVGRAS